MNELLFQEIKRIFFPVKLCVKLCTVHLTKMHRRGINQEFILASYYMYKLFVHDSCVTAFVAYGFVMDICDHDTLGN